MWYILIIIFIAGFMPGLLYGAVSLIGHTFMARRESSGPFECGFDPKSSARVPFSSRFFSLAVLFLVFDVEVVILYPLPMISFSSSNVVVGVVSFLILLVLGLFHEWREGSLEWAR